MCEIEECQLVLHDMCQTEWESHQYHLECPNDNLSLSKYVLVERRDASTIILTASWQFRQYLRPLQKLE